MSRPTTALLIPCYNAERYLENLRKQLDALDPAFDEIVVVDDGSTDGTVAKARNLGFDIVPLGVNRGPGAARNAAASQAKAEWIHFLDADDEIAPDYLAKVLPVAVDGVDVVLSSTEFVDEDTREPTLRWEYPDEAFRSNALRGTIVHPVLLHSSFIRRSSFETIRGFDEDHRCWEDGDLHVRLAASGARFRTIPDLLAWSPRHKRGTSGSDLYCHRCRLDFLEKYAAYVPRIPAADLVHETIVNATRLYNEEDAKNANRALDLACHLGWKGPESRNPLLGALWKVPSKRLRKTLFRLQMSKRQEEGKSKRLEGVKVASSR
jgi:glycosyltransferase involved in cell wall biosynthesis